MDYSEPGNRLSKGLLKLSIQVFGDHVDLLVHQVRYRFLSTDENKPCSTYIQMALSDAASDAAVSRTSLCSSDVSSTCFNQLLSCYFTPADTKRRLIVSSWKKTSQESCPQLIGCLSFGMKHLKRKARDKPLVGWYHLLPERLGRRKHLQLSDASGCPGSKKEDISVEMNNVIQVRLNRGASGYGFTVKGSCPVVIGHVKKFSSADGVSLKRGDRIVRVNEDDVVNASMRTVAQLVRNSIDAVTLTVQRPVKHHPLGHILCGGRAIAQKENLLVYTLDNSHHSLSTPDRLPPKLDVSSPCCMTLLRSAKKVVGKNEIDDDTSPALGAVKNECIPPVSSVIKDNADCYRTDQFSVEKTIKRALFSPTSSSKRRKTVQPLQSFNPYVTGDVRKSSSRRAASHVAQDAPEAKEDGISGQGTLPSEVCDDLCDFEDIYQEITDSRSAVIEQLQQDSSNPAKTDIGCGETSSAHCTQTSHIQSESSAVGADLNQAFIVSSVVEECETTSKRPFVWDPSLSVISKHDCQTTQRHDYYNIGSLNQCGRRQRSEHQQRKSVRRTCDICDTDFANDRNDQRTSISSRFISCEEDFVQDIILGVQMFSRPLRHCILSQLQHSILFQNIEKLMTLSEYSIRQMTSSKCPGSTAVDWSTVIMTYKSKVSLLYDSYGHYISGLDGANSLLQQLYCYDEFRSFLRKSTKEMTVEYLLYRPVQHIENLCGLLIELQRSIHPSLPQYTQLSAVVQSISEICGQTSAAGLRTTRTIVDSGVHSFSCSQLPVTCRDSSVLELQSRLVFDGHVKPFQLTSSLRHTIYASEVLGLGDTECSLWLVLLTDLLLVTSKTVSRSGSERLKVLESPIPLDVMTCNFDLNHPSEFEISWKERRSARGSKDNLERLRSLRVRAPTLEEKCVWRQIINHRMTVCRSNNNTLIR